MLGGRGGSYVGQSEVEWTKLFHRKTEGARGDHAAASGCSSKSWWQVQVEGRGASLPGTGASAGAPLTPTDTTGDQRRPHLPRGLIDT